MTDKSNTLPEQFARDRILSAKQSASLWGVSIATWRRMYRGNAIPAAIRLSERRLGWRAGDILDALASRQSRSAA